MDDHLTKEDLVLHLKRVAIQKRTQAASERTQRAAFHAERSEGRAEAYSQVACLLEHEDIVFVPRAEYEEWKKEN